MPETTLFFTFQILLPQHGVRPFSVMDGLELIFCWDRYTLTLEGTEHCVVDIVLEGVRRGCEGD